MSEYVYIRSEPGLWTVGYHEPGGKFIPESDHDSPGEAARQVTTLNGGADETEVLRKLLTLPLQNRAPEVAVLLKQCLGMDQGPWRSGGDIAAVLIAWFEANGFDTDTGEPRR